MKPHNVMALRGYLKSNGCQARLRV